MDYLCFCHILLSSPWQRKKIGKFLINYRTQVITYILICRAFQVERDRMFSPSIYVSAAAILTKYSDFKRYNDRVSLCLAGTIRATIVFAAICQAQFCQQSMSRIFQQRQRRRQRPARAEKGEEEKKLVDRKLSANWSILDIYFTLIFRVKVCVRCAWKRCIIWYTFISKYKNTFN